MIPQTYEQWKNCIINDCKIELNHNFVQTRLAVYEDPKNKETQKFVSLYGENHLQNIIGWLKRIH